MKFDSRKDQRRLADFIARYVNETLGFSRRGLWLSVQEVDVRGRPPERIRLWGVLHFLTQGNPFLCPETSDYLFFKPPHTDDIGEAVRKHLRLRDPISVEFVAVNAAETDGIRFDLFANRTSVPANINERDELGRTAIFRAATRGFASQVEELLATGADVRIPNLDGRTLEQLAAEGSLDEDIELMIESHIAEM